MSAKNEKLIIAVCARPELYDTKLVMYRDRAVRKKTWCSVSEEVGLPPDQCRKRWKSLRDLYMREKRKEMQRRNRPEGGPCKRWKYSAVPSFLDPFFSPREMNGNMDAKDLIVITTTKTVSCFSVPPSQLIIIFLFFTSIGSRKKRKRSWDEHVDFEREILRALQAEPQPLPPPPPLSETELFLKSLIPMIDRLPPMRKGALKLKIHSLVFEAVSEFM
uniref:MADF domain-containing protein n=1 Tax=Oryzias latipes TaxID=8090 RepID=H2MF20_ORYLA